MNSDSDQVRQFWTDGYVRFRNLLTAEEIAALRKKVELIRQRSLSEGSIHYERRYPDGKWIVGDLPGMPELKEHRYVLFDDRIVACAKKLLGEQLVYFGDSSVQTGEGIRGYHKDNIDRNETGPDWQGDYKLTQFGIYLQDHAKYGGGLKLRIGSQKIISRTQGKAVNVPSEIGDVVVWSSRITHSGNVVRLKACPSAVLPPRLENLTPRFLRVPDPQERMVIFLTFAAPGPHADRYIEYEAKREDCRNYWKKACINPEIRALAEKHGIELRQPIPDYGSLNPLHQA